jgi:hypothetical protein
VTPTIWVVSETGLQGPETGVYWEAEIGAQGSTVRVKEKLRDLVVCHCSMSSAIAESDADSEPQIIQTPASYTFLPAQLQLLQENVETVKAGDNVKARHKLIKSIRKQILALPESKNLSVEVRADLARAIDSWFSVRTRRSRSTVKFVKKWTGRLVMYEENKQRVNELKSELYEKARRQGKEPTNAFSYFQQAITKIWDEASKEEQVRYGNLAKRWNKDGVSREQKQE